MNLKEIKELVDLMTEKGITEFELERSGTKVRIKRGQNSAPDSLAGLAAVISHAALPARGPMQAMPPPAPPPTIEHPPATERSGLPSEHRAEDLHIVKSPIVGTFYEGPSPGAPPFVSIGDHVEVGQALCIIEAMKLMNDIETDVAGEVVKRYVENAQPVEYGEFLFAIRPARGKK